MAVNKLMVAVLLVGALIRLWMFNSATIRNWIESRLEISTPLSSWNRVLEGIYLKKIGLSSTYEGDLVHELPMMLNFYEFLISLPFDTRYIFVLFDVLNAVLLYMIVKKSIEIFQASEKKDMKENKYKRLVETVDKFELDKFLLSPLTFNAEYWALIAFGVYTLNPFCIVSCVAQSTVGIHNFVLLAWFLALVKGQTLVAYIFLAVHTNMNIYTGSLIVASVLFVYENSQKKPNSLLKYMGQNLIVFSGLVGCVFGINLWLEDYNTRFVECTYFFILKVPDLVPNLGVFWYFFTEMFDHFRLFFTYVFQFNVLLYAIPISIRLRHEPILSILIQLGLISTLKSYPSIGDTGLFLSMVPMVAYLFPLLRNFLIYFCMLAASVVLAPIMFYLWVGSGGGNANFYFAITLVYSVGLIFLITDIFYASLKREFIKLNGATIPKSRNGQQAQFALE